jgi:hypothetical protein
MDKVTVVKLFRKELMDRHFDDWTMETIGEAARICADAAEAHYQERARAAIERSKPEEHFYVAYNLGVRDYHANLLRDFGLDQMEDPAA